MIPIMQNFLPKFVSAYRNHMEKNLDNNKIVGTVFMDLSKVFDFIPHELLYSQNAGLWLR